MREGRSQHRQNVAKAIGLEPHLGPRFLQAGLGLGGSCFKNAILSLPYLADARQLPEVAKCWRSVIKLDHSQCWRFVESVARKLNGNLRGKKVAIIGYALKKDTLDTPESQASEAIGMLVPECPLEIAMYDPQCDRKHVESELSNLLASGTSLSILKPEGPVPVCDSPYDACISATAVLILTECDHSR